jgi:cyclic-di-AMP phosphodiesterase PgpH
MPNSRHNRLKGPTLFGYRLSEQRVRRIVIALVTALIVFFLLLARLVPEAVSYQVGDTATRTIKATRAALYVDKDATERLREDAARAVPDVYTRDANADGRALQTIDDISDVANQVRADAAVPQLADKISLLRERLDIQLSDDSLRLLIQSGKGPLQRVEQSANLLVRQAMSKPIRTNTDDLARARAELPRLADTLGLTDKYQNLLVEMAQAAVQPNMLFDAAATEAKRDEIRSKVAEVHRQVQPGDIVISMGDAVRQSHLDMFAALGLITPSLDPLQALSLQAVVLVLMMALFLYVRTFARDVYADDRSFMLLCFTLIATTALLSLFKSTPWFEVLALSLTTMTAIFLALTLRSLVAVGASFFLGPIAGLAAPGSDARLILAATFCAVLAAHAARPRSSRSSTITRASMFTAVANTGIFYVTSYVFGFIIQPGALGYTALGGFLSAIIAAGLVSIIERPLSLTTHLRLLELQDPNTPILKRLLTEAPGSYQSSVMVANLAEPAAEAVGADGVLTRTACMYHDIGKLKRPYFFIENQFGVENPHTRLSPHLSALVIMSHVKDGIELAQQMHLPPEVASVIPQHHGTLLVSFMYQKAQAEAVEGEEVRESDFRYPGPKPQTKENAVIMLADTVEATARTLEDASPHAIEEMVERLVSARIADGQLDESPLTFANIKVIQESFVKTLTGMFHQRLAYPGAAPAHEISVVRDREGVIPIDD